MMSTYHRGDLLSLASVFFYFRMAKNDLCRRSRERSHTKTGEENFFFKSSICFDFHLGHTINPNHIYSMHVVVAYVYQKSELFPSLMVNRKNMSDSIC